ncbi:MAG: MATE family efflux transporter [Campylobacterales bacterium]|nr:MATE family efflux transporter [Campylobacterales bacterium]
MLSYFRANTLASSTILRTKQRLEQKDSRTVKPSTHSREVLRLALPAALKHLIDILQILIDMLMVGSLGIAALAAVGMSMQFMMVLNVMMTLIVVGGNTVISRYIGQQRRNRASALLFSLLGFSALLSIPVGIGGYFGADHFYIWMDAGEDVVAQGDAYFSLICAGAILIFFDSLFFNALSAAGDTKSSLYIKVVSALINALLNYLLIFGHGGFEAMGIAGAAVATLIAYAFNVIVYAILLFYSSGVLRFMPVIRLTDLKKAFRLGSSSALERLITVATFLLFVMIITQYGTAALAGYQVGLRIEGIAFMPGFGFSVAAMALVGQNLGAKNPELAYRSGRYSAWLSVWFMGSVGVIMVVWPQWLCAPFTTDPETVEAASLYLQLVGISQVPLALTFVLGGALRGAGATKSVMMINVLSLWFLRVVPSFFALWMGWPLMAIFVIMTVETFIKGALFWKVFESRQWQKIRI